MTVPISWYAEQAVGELELRREVHLMLARRTHRNLACCGMVALALSSSACSSGPPLTSKESRMTSEITSSGSRIGQPALAPILYDGKRYQQIMNGEREGLGQRTGLMAVYDLANNTRIVVKIYDYPREPGLEADAGDVFFTVFKLDPGKREILIENERRQRFAYRIDDGTVRTLE
jgi:hypothetical protein